MKMKHLILQPPPPLRAYVKYFWTFEVTGNDNKHLQIGTFVNDSSGITIQHNNGRSAIKESGAFIPASMVYGISTQSKVHYPVSAFKAIGVLFQPYAMSEIFGVDAADFTDQEIHLNDLAGWNIYDAILNTPDLHKQIDLLSGFLLQLVSQNIHRGDGLIKQCVADIQTKKGLVTVAHLLEKYAISERQLERRFMATIGVSPRHYLKVTRFGEVLSLLKSTDTINLAEVAHALNYSDQAHFIRHVKQLSGLTPKVLQKKLLEVPVNQVGSTPYLLGTTITDFS
jgi:AraC-like DNA-binding protein